MEESEASDAILIPSTAAKESSDTMINFWEYRESYCDRWDQKSVEENSFKFHTLNEWVQR